MNKESLKPQLCGRYLGEWRHDEQTGAVEKAVINAPDGSGGVYSGMFREGLPNGKGKLAQEDGGSYEVRSI